MCGQPSGFLTCAQGRGPQRWAACLLSSHRPLGLKDTFSSVCCIPLGDTSHNVFYAKGTSSGREWCLLDLAIGCINKLMASVTPGIRIPGLLI